LLSLFAVLIFAIFGLFLLHARLDPSHASPLRRDIILSTHPLLEPAESLAQIAVSKPSDQCVVMFDNRPAPPPSSASELDDSPYLSLSAAANSLYARYHGYRFLFYNFSHAGCRHPALEGQWRDLPMTWCKLAVLEDALFHARRPCQSVLLLDSDAVVANVTQRLEDFAAAHGRAAVLVGHLDEALLREGRERLWERHGVDVGHPWMFFSQPGGGNVLNAGVMIFRREGDGRKLRAILDEWWRAAVREPAILRPGRPRPCWGNCLRNWPHEQAVFELFVWPRFREDVRLLPLQLLNGFSGAFVRHVWGLKSEHRRRVFEDAFVDGLRRAYGTPDEGVSDREGLALAVAAALAKFSPGIVVPRPAGAEREPAARCGRC